MLSTEESFSDERSQASTPPVSNQSSPEMVISPKVPSETKTDDIGEEIDESMEPWTGIPWSLDEVSSMQPVDFSRATAS